jgi:monofunctional biosynthetic peptidoglycan transglycosylase
MATRRRPGGRWWLWLVVPPALFLLWLFALWPPPVWYRTHFPAETAFMRMRRADAPLLSAPARAYDPVPLDRIAPAMALAAITGEDNHFWEHGGLDYASLRKALGYRRARFEWTDDRDRAELRRALGRAWERREKLRGASTITQQLAKNLYLSPSRNPLRKLKEAVTAYRLESALGKRRILELYLNVAEMGDEVWGVEAASRRYFRKPAAKLTRSEAAALAGLLPFPLRSNPLRKPGRMKWRQNLILRRMAGERIEIPPDDAEPPEGVDLDDLFNRDSQ